MLLRGKSYIKHIQTELNLFSIYESQEGFLIISIGIHEGTFRRNRYEIKIIRKVY